MGPPSNEERVYGFIDLFKQVGDARPTQIYSLRTKEIKIGREHKCDIRIHNLRISRLQCCVNISGPEDNQKVRLRNLTSKTTTYYNNRSINLDEQVELKDGERFRLYDTELRFRDFKANDPPPEAMSGKPVPVIRLAAKEKAGHHSSTPNKIPSLLKTPKSEKIKSSSPSRSSERMNKTTGSTPNGGRVEMDRTPKRRRSSDVELRKAVLQRRFRKSVQGKAFPPEISEGPEAEDDEEEDEDEQEDEEEGESTADQDSAKSAATNDTLLSDSLTESVPEKTSYIVPEDENVDLLAPVVVDPPAVSPKNQSQDLIEFAEIEREMFQLHEEGDKTNNNNNVQDTSSNAETSESTSKAASSESDQPIQVDVMANGYKDAEDTVLLDSNGVVVDINTEMDTQVINDFPGIIDDSFSSRWNDSGTTFGRSFHTAADNDEQDLSFEPMEVDEEPLNDQTGTTNADGSFYDACVDQNVTDDMFSVIEAEDIPADPGTPVIQQSVEAATEELEILEDGVKDAEVNGNSASSSCEPDTQETVTSSASQGSCFESVSIEQIEEELADMFEPDEEEGGTGRETIPETENAIGDDDTAKKDDENAEKGVDDAKLADDDTKKIDDEKEKEEDDAKKIDDDVEKVDVETISSSDSPVTPELAGESEASDPDVENRNVTVTSPVVETQDDSFGLGEIFSESAVEIVEVTESAENKETEDTETTSDDVVNEGSSVSVSDVESDEESPAVVATVEITEMDTQVIVEETETPVPEELELETEAEFAAEPVVLADKTVEEMDSLCFPDTPRQSVNVATTSSLMPDVEENEVVEEPVEAGATSPVDSVPAPEASRPSDSTATSSSEKQSAETPEVAITSDDEVTAIDAPSGSKRASVVTRRVSRSATASRHIVTISDSDEEQTNTSEEPKDKTVKTPKSLFKKPTGTPIRTPAKTCRDTDDGDSSDDCVAIRSSALSTPRQTRGRQTNSDNDVNKRNAMTTPRARQTRTALRSKGFTTPSQKEQAKSSDSSDVEVIDCEPELTNTSSLIPKNSEKPIVAEAELDLQEMNDEPMAVNDESVAGNEESLARKDESVAINEESVAGNDESVAIIEESVAENEESVAEPAEISLPTAESDIEDDLQSLADDAGSSKKPLKASDMQRSKIDIIMEDDEKSADGLGDPDVSLDLEEAAQEEEDDAEEFDEPDASASSDVDDEEVAKSPEIKLREFSVVLKRLEMDFDKSSSEEEEDSEEEVSISKSEEIDFQDEEEGALETLAEDHESESDASEREDEVPRRRSKKSHLPLSLYEAVPNTSEVASTSGKSTARHSSEVDVEMVEIEEDAGSTCPEKQSSAHETSADMKSVRNHVDDVEMVEDEADSQEESITNSRLTGDDEEEGEEEENAEAHPKASRRSASKALKVSEAEDDENTSNASPRKSSRRSSLKSVDSEKVATPSRVARISRRSSKVAESEEVKQEERSRSSSRTPRRTASKGTKGKKEKESSPESSPIKRSVGSTSKTQADDNESEGHEVTSPVASSSKKLSTSKMSTEVSSPQLEARSYQPEARSSEPEGSSPEHEARSPSKSTEESPREPRKSYTTKYGIKYDASIKLRDLKIILDRLEETEEGRRRQPKRGEIKGKESDKRDVEYVDLEEGSSNSEASEMSQLPVSRSARKSSSSTQVSQSGRRSQTNNVSSAEASDALEDDEVETEPKVQEEEVPSVETLKRHKSNSPVRSSKKAVVEPTAPASSDENISEDNVLSQSDDLSDAETIPIKTTPRPRKPLIASKTPKSTPRRGRSANPDVVVLEDEENEEEDEDAEKEHEEVEKEDDQPQKAHSSRSKRGKALTQTPKKTEVKKGRAKKVPSADESEESSEESEKTDLDKQDAGKTRKAKAEPPSRGRNLRKHTVSEASIETVAIESKKKKDQESKKPARAAKNAAAEVDEEALESLSSHGRKTRRNDVEVVKESKSTRRGNKAKEPVDDEVFIEPEAPPTRGKRGQHEKKVEEPKKSPIKRSGRMKLPSEDASEEPVISKRTRRNDHTEDEEESEAESVKAVVSKAVVTKSRQKQTITTQKIQEEDESDVEESEERPKSRKDTDESSQERPAPRARGRPRKNADESSSQERSDSSSSKVNERSTRRKPAEIVTIDEPVSMEGGRKQQKAKGGKKGLKDEEQSVDKEAPKKPTSPPAASSSSRFKPKPVVELTRLNVPTRSPRVTRAQSTDAEPVAAPAPVQLPKRKKREATKDPQENHDEEPPSDTESVSSRTRGRGTKEPQEGTQSKGTRSKKPKNDPPAKATKSSKRKPPVEEVEIVEVDDEEEDEEAPKEKAKPKRAAAKAKAAKAQERVNEAEEKGNESDVVEEPKTRSERRVKADSSKSKKPVAQVTTEEEPKAKRLRRADAKTTQVSKSSKATRAKAVEGKSDDEEEEEEKEEQQGEKPQKASKSTKRTRRAAEVEEEQEVVIAAETKRDRRKQPTAMETVAEEVPKPVRRGKTARQANAKAESTSRVVLQLPPDTNDEVIEISDDEEEERPQSRAKRARTDKDQVKPPVTVTATRATRRRGK